MPLPGLLHGEAAAMLVGSMSDTGLLAEANANTCARARPSEPRERLSKSLVVSATKKGGRGRVYRIV